MLQYVNSFSCSLSETKDTLVIHFIQNEPTIPDLDDNTRVEIVRHDIASVIMDSDCAKGLMSSLNQLFNSSEENKDANQ